MEKAGPVEPKPFIFLDVSVLREYLTIELNVATPFPFDVELAIDDWIFMIFFVGNDFLPHLPSLEIREGAIDVLLKIWKSELHRMGGYLTNHGKVDLSRAQVILEGLAKSEDEIFQKRKEDEDRQESRQKRQRIEDYRRQDEAAARANGGGGNSMQLNGQEYKAVDIAAATARGGTLHPSLPSRPTFDIVPKAEAGAPAPKSKKMSASQREAAALAKGSDAILAMSGSNKDYVDNRKQIRLANLSAAQALKAELAGTAPEADLEASEEKTVTLQRVEDGEKEEMLAGTAQSLLTEKEEDEGVNLEVVDEGMRQDEDEVEAPVEREEDASLDQPAAPLTNGVIGDATVGGDAMEDGSSDSVSRGRGETKAGESKKRKASEAELPDDADAADEEDEAPPNPEADQPVPKKSKLKVNADGTIDGYVDDVRLWEPGYRERYYKSKFGVDLGDREFLDQCALLLIPECCD